VTIIFFMMPPFLMSKSLRQFGSNKSHIVSLPQSSFTSPTHDLFFVPLVRISADIGRCKDADNGNYRDACDVTPSLLSMARIRRGSILRERRSSPTLTADQGGPKAEAGSVLLSKCGR
jgi:hypothetical protein